MANTEPAHKKAVQEAIEIVGTQQALADAINAFSGENLKQGHIYKWLNAKRIPLERAFQIQRATCGLVTKERLRPDFDFDFYT